MKIHFIVGTIGSGRGKIFKKLLGVLKKLPNTKAIGDGIGGTYGSDIIPNVNILSKEFCMYEINMALTQFSGNDHFVFTGAGLSANIKEIMAAYPDAALYIVRRTDPDVAIKEGFKELMIERIGESESWILDHNAQVRSSLENLADDLGLNWKLVNSPVFLTNNTPNWTSSGEEPTTNIEMAIYNL